MSIDLSLNELIAYTDWERGKWQARFRERGESILAISVGGHGDGRFQTLGDMIRHIFSAEMRYIDRLSNRPITDTASIPNNSVEALFQFGARSRASLNEFLQTFPAQQWDVLQELTLMNTLLRVTPRKIVAHVLLHEIRHWAQIGTLLRLNGVTDDFHDFLFSPALGGEFKKMAS